MIHVATTLSAWGLSACEHLPCWPWWMATGSDWTSHRWSGGGQMVPPGSGADPCCSETVDQGGPRRGSIGWAENCTKEIRQCCRIQSVQSDNIYLTFSHTSLCSVHNSPSSHMKLTFSESLRVKPESTCSTAHCWPWAMKWSLWHHVCIATVYLFLAHELTCVQILLSKREYVSLSWPSL